MVSGVSFYIDPPYMFRFSFISSLSDVFADDSDVIESEDDYEL